MNRPTIPENEQIGLDVYLHNTWHWLRDIRDAVLKISDVLATERASRADIEARLHTRADTMKKEFEEKVDAVREAVLAASREALREAALAEFRRDLVEEINRDLARAVEDAIVRALEASPGVTHER